MACNNGDDGSTELVESGYLKFAVEAVEEVGNITTRANEITIGTAAGEGYVAPQSGNFTVDIKKENGDVVYQGLLSGWDVAKKLREGYYNVKASYGTEAVGFNKPLFAGVNKGVDFTIVGGQTTQVSIPVTLQNAIVRLQYTDMFKNYYHFDKIVLTQGTNIVDFLPTETRGAFVDATSFTLSATFTSQNGASKTFSKEYSASKANCYTIKFDVSNVGGNSIDITFGDNPTETVDLGGIELNPKE